LERLFCSCRHEYRSGSIWKKHRTHYELSEGLRVPFYNYRRSTYRGGYSWDAELYCRIQDIFPTELSKRNYSRSLICMSTFFWKRTQKISIDRSRICEKMWNSDVNINEKRVPVLSKNYIECISLSKNSYLSMSFLIFFEYKWMRGISLKKTLCFMEVQIPKYHQID
jgi:hypothetical protein